MPLNLWEKIIIKLNKRELKKTHKKTNTQNGFLPRQVLTLFKNSLAIVCY